MHVPVNKSTVNKKPTPLHLMYHYKHTVCVYGWMCVCVCMGGCVCVWVCVCVCGWVDGCVHVRTCLLRRSYSSLTFDKNSKQKRIVQINIALSEETLGLGIEILFGDLRQNI